VPATATVRARTRMKVLLVRRADAAALKHQPDIKAALYRTQTESSVLDVLESFATYDNEVTTIDDLRKSLQAASSSFSAAAQLSAIAAASGYSGSQSQGCAFPCGVCQSSGVFSPAGLVAGAAGSGSSSLATLAGAAMPPSPRGDVGATLGGRTSSRVRGSPSFTAALAAAAGGAFGGTGGYNTASFSALGTLRPASRGNSFTAAAAAAAQAAAAGGGVSCPLLQLPQQGSGGYAGTGVVTPPSGSPVVGCMSSSSSFGVMAGMLQHPASPSRGSSSTRFALSAAASGSVPISRELSPVPTSTPAALAAAAREAAGVGSRQVSQRAMFQQKQQQQQ
jgi:hypothetical protein